MAVAGQSGVADGPHYLIAGSAGIRSVAAEFGEQFPLDGHRASIPRGERLNGRDEPVQVMRRAGTEFLGQPLDARRLESHVASIAAGDGARIGRLDDFRRTLVCLLVWALGATPGTPRSEPYGA